MFETANGWLKTFTDLGVSVIIAAVVIDILFSTNYVLGGLSETVANFSDKGLSGFIALLLFVIFWSKRGEAAAS